MKKSAAPRDYFIRSAAVNQEKSPVFSLFFVLFNREIPTKHLPIPSIHLILPHNVKAAVSFFDAGRPDAVKLDFPKARQVVRRFVDLESETLAAYRVKAQTNDG